MSWNQYMVPINQNGIITDIYLPDVILETSSDDNEVLFCQVHGWDTDGDVSMANTNLLQAGLSTRTKKQVQAFSLHWPSKVEGAGVVVNDILQPLSFYTMEARANSIGMHALATLIQLYVAANKKLKAIWLFGHSFGCKVVLNAIQNLPSMLIPIRVVLVEAATDSSDFEATGEYPDVLKSVNKLAFTHSDNDFALKRYFPLAQEINVFRKTDCRTALGYAGLTFVTMQLLYRDYKTINIDKGFTRQNVPTCDILSANITPVQDAFPAPNPGLEGQHSNYFLPEVYEFAMGIYES